jgi:hypothetical protein
MAENNDTQSRTASSRVGNEIHERVERLREKVSELSETLSGIQETLKETRSDSGD